jgi:hypothetical protein
LMCAPQRKYIICHRMLTWSSVFTNKICLSVPPISKTFTIICHCREPRCHQLPQKCLFAEMCIFPSRILWFFPLPLLNPKWTSKQLSSWHRLHPPSGSVSAAAHSSKVQACNDDFVVAQLS